MIPGKMNPVLPFLINTLLHFNLQIKINTRTQSNEALFSINIQINILYILYVLNI